MLEKPMAMRMLVTDDELAIVQLAKAKEHHDRATELGRLFNLKLVVAINDEDINNVRLRVGEEIFAEPRDVFPSIQLMARIQLAIAAGQAALASDDNLWAFSRAVASDNLWAFARADTMELAYANVAKITGAVKRRQKGLRP